MKKNPNDSTYSIFADMLSPGVHIFDRIEGHRTVADVVIDNMSVEVRYTDGERDFFPTTYRVLCVQLDADAIEA